MKNESKNRKFASNFILHKKTYKIEK